VTKAGVCLLLVFERAIGNPKSVEQHNVRNGILSIDNEGLAIVGPVGTKNRGEGQLRGNPVVPGGRLKYLNDILCRECADEFPVGTEHWQRVSERLRLFPQCSN